MKKLMLLVTLLTCLTLTAFTADTGEWVYEKSINPLNDKTVVTFKLECETNEAEEPIFLILKKEGKKTSICIDWNVEITSVNYGSVSIIMRFGDSKAIRSTKWRTHRALKEILIETIYGEQPKQATPYTFYFGRKTRFIRKVMGVDRFVVEIRGMNRSLTAVFDVRGLENAVEQFNNILNWIKE